MTDAYSKTHLVKKLGIKAGFKIIIKKSPCDYESFFGEWPNEIKILKRPKAKTADFIHVFITNVSELEKRVLPLKKHLKKDGIMWVSWPKGKSRLPTNLKRDVIRNYLLENGLVDVKIASINEDWSALKFVYRLKDRKANQQL